MGQIVWYLEKPTIGYCRECETLGTYLSSHGGLVCPNDPKHHDQKRWADKIKEASLEK